ncbi:uncharacterized protein DMAD_13276 [Drosophila madeirensis]|uniref:Bromo domain-containing protein n=1 Tax=Drosophila madeirensis TaxID=30013 RepID=A0AAU9FK12_DROMD
MDRVGSYTNKIHYIKKNILEGLTNKQYAQLFMRPIDERCRNYEKLTKPMDLGTIINRVQTRCYQSAREVAADLRLVYQNWFALNEQCPVLCRPGIQLQKFVERKLSQMPEGPEFVIRKDPRMTRTSIKDFPWLQSSEPQLDSNQLFFIPEHQTLASRDVNSQYPKRGHSVSDGNEEDSSGPSVSKMMRHSRNSSDSNSVLVSVSASVSVAGSESVDTISNINNPQLEDAPVTSDLQHLASPENKPSSSRSSSSPSSSSSSSSQSGSSSSSSSSSGTDSDSDSD